MIASEAPREFIDYSNLERIDFEQSTLGAEFRLKDDIRSSKTLRDSDTVSHCLDFGISNIISHKDINNPVSPTHPNSLGQYSR